MTEHPQSRRGTLLFVSGVSLVLLVVTVGYLLILHRPESSSRPAAKPEPVKVVAAQLIRADGAVQMRFGEGDWQNASVGAAVAPGTDLRTGEGASAALSYPGSLDVEIAADADFRLEQVDENVAKVVVRGGLVVADVRPESGKLLQMSVAGSDAVAETRDGRVHVLTDGKGKVQAAVSRGTATVGAGGEKVQLLAGYQTTVTPGSAPQPPSLVPHSLLLKVRWPPESMTAKRRQLVVGTTNPGVRVRIGDTFAIADGLGQFRAVIELNEGSNEIRAYALDVYGRTEQARSPAIELDTRAPYQEIKTDPGMWKKPSAR